MSEEKRKNARLQGRFSDDHRPSRKEKQKRSSDTNREDGASGSVKGKNSESKLFQSAEGLDLKFDKHANISFQQFEEKVKPLEINTSGEHILSTTENGRSRVLFEPEFIPKEEADELMTIINSATTWYDKNIVIHGQEVPQPRLVAWFGPFPYAYSGAMLDAAEMTPCLVKIKERVEKYLRSHDIDVDLNSVLLNLYRNEKDSVAWHSDDELSLGCCPTIASVSLGAVRRFQMKIKPHVRDSDKNLVSTEYFINLTPGSLVIMDGCMQKDWKHQVPKEYHDRPPRINLTFRTVYPSDKLPIQVPLKSSDSSSNVSNLKENKHILKEENKHIFDSSNFPPLGTISTQSETNFDIPQNSCVASKSKIGNTIEVYDSRTNQIDPDSVPSSSDDKDELTYSNAENQQRVPNQNFDTVSVMPENGNTFVATDVTVSDSQSEQVSFISEASHTDNGLEWEKEVNDRARFYAEGPAEDSVCVNKEEKYTSRQQRSQLNAEASEFVPKCHGFSNDSASPSELEYDKITMIRLADCYENGKVPYSRYDEFFKALSDKIYQNPSFFLERDHYELDVLCNLNDGSQTEKNQTIILGRLCSMIQNAARYKSRRNVPGYYGPQQNRTPYRDANRQFRGGSYKGPGYKARGFKD